MEGARLRRHATAHRVEQMEDIGVRNYGVRPSGGDVFADTVVGRQAFNTASVLALDDMGEQFVALHVVDECAVNKVLAHVVPVYFFTEGSKDLGGAETNVAVNDIISKKTTSGRARTDEAASNYYAIAHRTGSKQNRST